MFLKEHATWLRGIGENRMPKHTVKARDVIRQLDDRKIELEKEAKRMERTLAICSNNSSRALAERIIELESRLEVGTSKEVFEEEAYEDDQSQLPTSFQRGWEAALKKLKVPLSHRL